MTWWLVEANPAGADPEPLARALAELTGHTTLESRDRVVGYAVDQESAERIGQALSARFGGSLAISINEEPAVDWSTAWRDGLAVRDVAGLRLGPSWLLTPAADAVVIDPETAFGSGEHGSTRGALTLLAHHLHSGGTVLDLGSGSGILTIAAAKLGARSALGVEVDEEAVPIAEFNAARNEVAERVRFVVADAAAVTALAGPVDVVVSNILRNVNETLLDSIAAALHPAGVAVFAGMEAGESGLFRAALETAGFEVVDEMVDEGWWSVAVHRARTSR